MERAIYVCLWISAAFGMALAGEFCDNTLQYCSDGCCGTTGNQYCCDVYNVLAVWVIVLIVIGAIITISTIVAVVCCCVRNRGRPGLIVNQQSPQMIMTTAQYHNQGIAYPQVATPGYPYQTNLVAATSQQQVGYQPPQFQTAYPAGQQTNQAYSSSGIEKENQSGPPPVYQE